MLNKEKHQLLMGKILKDIYSDVTISSLLGFKGGTSGYFFYGLPRFSVDLDFDLLDEKSLYQAVVYDTVTKILQKHGDIKDNYLKHNTIFFLISYGDADHNIKIEISTRKIASDIRKYYEQMKYLGISMNVAKKDYLFSSKLIALTARREIAMRDIYDIWYFGKNNWDINAEVIKSRTNKDVIEYLDECIASVEAVKGNQILRGLGELLSEEEKIWTKTHLRMEVIFLLKNYKSVLERKNK